jgi:hypothetical protein
VIDPADVDHYVALDFTAFSTVNNYDWLYIHDGHSVGAPLIGRYSGFQLQGQRVTSSTGELRLPLRQLRQGVSKPVTHTVRGCPYV